MSLHSEAIAENAESLLDEVGESYTYKRGAFEKTIAAIPARTEFEELDIDGAVVARLKLHDFLIPPAELVGLVRPGEATEPNEGDVIVDADGNERTVSSMMGQPAWRWSDQYETWHRTHTKKTK